ncbi:MAG: ribonuclease E/G, partial [Prochlorococcaceae cyanobacterium]
RDALKPRVDLPSGGYVIIEPTEALTVVDVNSGSFTRSANARETVLWTNCEAATEIARQLKLRNIGGVVIVDFIDMESRRDQFLLLEHFVQSMRDDKSRPQIAQITELGLVELTRKRQGQNIYELFGRACPSCGGLGHVVTLPGRDTLLPLASLPGLVRSVASARAEVASPTAEGGGRRRRRGGRGGSSEAVAELPLDDQDQPATAVGSVAAVEPRRVEPELLAVPMDDTQELVYGWMGLSPALLADPPPADRNNVIVRVVRPGMESAELLQEARQELSSSGGRRRRRGRGGGDGRQNGSSRSDEGAPEPEPLPMVAITPLEIFDLPDEPEPNVVVETVAVAAAVSQEPEPEPELEDTGPGRRRRRRSSAS